MLDTAILHAQTAIRFEHGPSVKPTWPKREANVAFVQADFEGI
jgi:hypothetical protein